LQRGRSTLGTSCARSQLISHSLSIPVEASHLIARVAPLTTEQIQARELEAEEKRASLGRHEHGFKERVEAAIRKRRRQFW
jgi:hypothetical protein